ncbi:dihydroxyacetone kinase subunit DhaK [Pectinatus haikarae]|uniref:Dihydroxyacetone kinase-like protein n=1 Tax=Pectinatus haikarae TaxID=349096 RepID=A0ABT9YAW0_9FIRM|nr:dihydroxyacetone kinase subunit DhaK [Pectinatus haikarae]MDQ0204630.1 dihydroxyacetone kinase-like protein [Pectinatus haikarae]
MQRIINEPDYVVEDMLKGFLKCHADIVHADESNPRVVISNFAKSKKKVGIVTGGGSGHEPAFIGYCGKNMVDAVAVGEIFSSPTAKSFYDAICAVDQGMGVACLYGNYAGDNMNVKMARELAEDDGITVKTAVANDDAASASTEELNKRRGVAGEIFMWKIGGAKSEQGGTLDEVISAAQKAIRWTRSIGIGLSPCTIPANGKPNFHIEEGTMEFGIGHHGEPGVKIEKMGNAKTIAAEMTNMVIQDLPFADGDEAAVLISGLGATPVMEQYIFYNEVEQLLKDNGIHIYRSYVGNYFTSLEMNGLTLSVMKLDEELKECLDKEARTVGITQFKGEQRNELR